MSEKSITKRYRYECVCRKDPLYGTFRINAEREPILLGILDEGFAKSHDRPGCALKSKTIEPVERKKAAS